MLNEFTLEVKLPSGKEARISELKNSDYCSILKYCESDDLIGLNNIFNKLFFKNELKALNIIDKFYLLLYIRALFIGSTLQFTNKDNTPINFSIDNILDNVEQFEADFERIITIQHFVIELGLPNLLYFNDINDIYFSTIKTIKVGNNILKFDLLSVEEKETILDYIPTTVYSHINSYIEDLSVKLKGFILIEGDEEFGLSDVSIDIISNGVMGFIKSIFSTGLLNFYQMMYICANKIRIDGITYMNMTPVDANILLNFYNKDIEDQNKELQKRSRESK
jgi:hypothetical protein